MLITCPECQFARNINASSIPAKAQLATCPRCKTKFRFRILHEEEQLIVESVDDVPVAESVKEELSAATVQKESAAPLQKAAGDDVQTVSAAEEDYIESEMVAAMQEEIEELLRSDVDGDGKEPEEAVVEETPADEAEASADEVVQEPESQEVADVEPEEAEVSSESVLADAEEIFVPGVSAPATEEQDAVEADESEKDAAKPLVKRSASAQALHERGAISGDNLDPEEEAVKRYEQVQESSGMEAASAHIVQDTGEETDIWDAIAAMGDEHECTESFAPGCGSQVHIIPWEDGRLGIAGRVLSTFGRLLGHPRSFWRGVNAKPQLVLPVLFSVLMCGIAYGAAYGWSQILIANWNDFYTAVQGALPEQTFIPEVFAWPVFTMQQLGIAAGCILLLPFLLGSFTHAGAKMLGGSPVPFSTGVKCVAYSTGAFLWLLLPGFGALVALIYLPLLYVNGVRTGYNLSLPKTVVLVFTVSLLFIACVVMAIAAGVTVM